MIDDQLYQTYFQALLAGQRLQCGKIVQDLIENRVELKQLYHDLFHTSLYEVGKLWETNKISVAREHLATSITESLMNLTYPLIFSTERAGKKVVISCCANEFHQIGGKMVADIFEINGWDSYFLGPDMTYKDLLACVDQEYPDLVGLSLSILSNMDYLLQGIEMVKADFPHIDLLVGGQAFLWGGTDMIRQYSGTEYLPSMDALEAFIA